MTCLIRANDMKKYLSIIVVVLMASSVFAIFINKFTSWDDLIEQSPNIIIARCTSTLGTAKSEKPIAIVDGVIYSDIEVISVLKGNAKPGQARLASQYWPYQGEEFLLFANYENDQIYKGYTAIESYRVVPMSRYSSANDYLLTKVLPGKTLREQVQLILNHRLKDLDDEIARDNEEKNRLEMNMSSNVPPAVLRGP